MILKESNARKKNLALGWIGYKKAYDMIPHPWILECLGLVGIAQNIKNLLANSMNGWKTELTLPDDTNISSLKEDEGYKYLGVLEADVMLLRQMKEKTKKEYLRRVRKVAQTKLNGGNLIQAINTWAV